MITDVKLIIEVLAECRDSGSAADGYRTWSSFSVLIIQCKYFTTDIIPENVFPFQFRPFFPPVNIPSGH